MQKKLIRITTIPESLLILLRGQLKFMSEFYEVIAISSFTPALAKLKEEQEVRTVAINMTRKVTPFQDIKAIWKLYLFFYKERPYIVHTHTPKAGFLGMVAAWLARVPVRLHTVAGLPLMESNGNKRKILILVEKLTYKCAQKIYPNSFELSKYIIENKFTNEKKIKVIGNGSSNGIDTTYFDPALYTGERKRALRRSLNIRENETVFCFVGRIVRDKGIFELVSQFVQLTKTSSDLKLLLVGPFEQHLDPLDDDIVRQIKSHPNIVWLNFQEDVRPYLAISDIFVFPSYREGFPNVVMQAGAMGLPCIVTDINGCNEIINHEKNGIIVKPKNGQDLKKAMVKLLENKSLRNVMGSLSREMIVTRYDRHYLWKEILREYESFNYR